MRYSMVMLNVFLAILAVATLLELGISVPFTWPARRYLGELVVLLLVVASVGIVSERLNVLSILVLILSAYRIFNLARVVSRHEHKSGARRVASITSWRLILSQVLVLLTWLGIDQFRSSINSFWIGVITAQIIVAVLLLVSTLRSLAKTKYVQSTKHLSDAELPTVTVAVPARNEDGQLNASLESIIGSDYPKLEVLVLDDCSHDRTPEIIRTFAHDGVRFINGQPPNDDWLPKNQAYQRLLDEASGDIMLFAGVDVRFETTTIRGLVTNMVTKNKKMLSVLPINKECRAFLLIQPMRYFWELALPRRQLRRPPVLSSCWLIYRDVIKNLGGFEAIRKSITPEAYFAKKTSDHFDGYRFLRSNARLGLTSVKPLAEQRATAIRVRYPQLHRRPETVCWASINQLFWLVAPFGIALSGYSYHVNLALESAAIASSLALISVNVLIVRAAFPNHRLLGLVSFPIAACVDVALLNFSMYKYEFSEVYWKGRNICKPVMQVIPNLPKLR